MGLFTVVYEAQAIVQKKGVFKQSKIYQRPVGDGRQVGLYVAHGTGFVRLYGAGACGIPDMRWEELHGCTFEADKLGRLIRA